MQYRVLSLRASIEVVKVYVNMSHVIILNPVANGQTALDKLPSVFDESVIVLSKS